MRIPDHELKLRTAYRKEHGSEEGFVPPPRTRKKRDNEEFRIQCAFVKLWRANCGSLGIAQCLGFHIPNGSVMGGGNAEWQKKERAIRGRLQKLAGVEDGVVDWFLSVPMRTRRPSYGTVTTPDWWHGFYIEFKAPKGRTSPEQDAFIGFATARGYRCEIHIDATQAWQAVVNYLKI